MVERFEAGHSYKLTQPELFVDGCPINKIICEEYDLTLWFTVDELTNDGGFDSINGGCILPFSIFHNEGKYFEEVFHGNVLVGIIPLWYLQLSQVHTISEQLLEMVSNYDIETFATASFFIAKDSNGQLLVIDSDDIDLELYELEDPKGLLDTQLETFTIDEFFGYMSETDNLKQTIRDLVLDSIDYYLVRYL